MRNVFLLLAITATLFCYGCGGNNEVRLAELEVQKLQLQSEIVANETTKAQAEAEIASNDKLVAQGGIEIIAGEKDNAVIATGGGISRVAASENDVEWQIGNKQGVQVGSDQETGGVSDEEVDE